MRDTQPLLSRQPASDVPVSLHRPRLRGWVHAASVPGAIIVAVVLIRAASPGLPRLSAAVFGVALVALFATSGTYHLWRWSGRVRYWLSRADVAMIQLFIVASFTPVAAHTLTGAWRTWSLAVAWGVGIIGALVAASPLTGPRWLSVVGYTSTAALAIVPIGRIIAAISWQGMALIALSVVLYLAGGVVYAQRRPNPWPEWFGFHEVFHVLVVLGGAVHVVAVWEHVLPLR
jgi:hemolysin III